MFMVPYDSAIFEPEQFAYRCRSRYTAGLAALLARRCRYVSLPVFVLIAIRPTGLTVVRSGYLQNIEMLALSILGPVNEGEARCISTATRARCLKVELKLRRVNFDRDEFDT